MKAFRVLKSCTISYRDISKDPNDAHYATDFCLYEGDVFFIEPAGWYRIPGTTENNNYYKEVYKLSKIFYNKMDINGDREWTWINDINVIDPKINKHWSFAGNLMKTKWDCVEDVTTEWVRENKLEKLGI